MYIPRSMIVIGYERESKNRLPDHLSSSTRDIFEWIKLDRRMSTHFIVFVHEQSKEKVSADWVWSIYAFSGYAVIIIHMAVEDRLVDMLFINFRRLNCVCYS